VSELGQRVAVAAVGIPLAVGLLYIGGWVLGVAVALLAAGGALELYRLSTRTGVRPFAAAGAVLAAGTVLVAAARPAGAAALVAAAVLGATLLLLAAAIPLRGVSGRPLGAVAVTVFGVVLLGGSLSCAVLLHGLGGGASGWRGAALLAFPLALAWVGDTCAYFGGRAWGRHKLAPEVSPAKTVEGAVSSVVGTVVIGAVYAWAVFQQWQQLPIGPAAGAAAGLLASPAAQLGDLTESLLKREAAVKDSGRLLPGHGGILDRFDSALFVVPVIYAYLLVVLPLWVEGLPWR
jgi:phosphatidate cytidylyltransferase